MVLLVSAACFLCGAGGRGKVHHQGRRTAPHQQITFKGQLFVGGDDGVAANGQVFGEQAGGGQGCAAGQDPVLDEAAELAVELAVQIGGDAAVKGNAFKGEGDCHGGSQK